MSTKTSHLWLNLTDPKERKKIYSCFRFKKVVGTFRKTDKLVPDTYKNKERKL